jgi:hypothetical protein
MAQAGYVSSVIRAPRTGASVKPSNNPVRAAQAEFVTVLAGHPPCPIPLFAKSNDLEHRADHLRAVLNALSAYVVTILDDTAQNVPGGIDCRFVKALLSDLTTEVAGIAQNAAEDLAGRLA